MIGFYSFKNPEKVKEIKGKIYIAFKFLYNYGKKKFFYNSTDYSNSTLTKYKDKRYLSLEELDNL